jgi:type IV pilus assembly protein PilW
MNREFKKQSAFTMVEFLIAAVLGLILIAGVIQLFLGSNQNYKMQGDLSIIQEDGRLALMYLKSQIQQASWVPVDYITQIPSAIDWENSIDDISDTLIIQYVLRPDGINNRDCNGSIVTDGKIKNTYSVVNEQLTCNGNGGGGNQAIIANVANFQVLYGLDTLGTTINTDCPSGKVSRYLKKNDIPSNLKDNILSVRIGLVLESQNDVLDRNTNTTFTVLDSTFTRNDKKIYRLFTQTIFMPNAVFKTAGSTAAILNCL